MYAPEDFKDYQAPPKDAPASINIDTGPFNVEAEIAYKKALDNGLPDAAVELLNTTGANGHDSASESDFAAMGYLERAGLTANENAAVLLAHPRGDDIRERHPNTKEYLALSLGKLYANGAKRHVPPTGLTLADVDAVFDKWLLLCGHRAQHGVMAAVAAHKAGGEGVWVFVVDAPGSAKTETIRSLNGLDNVFPLSSLTPATLVSGQKIADGQKDPSLLLRLPDTPIVTLKDFTTVLSMHRDARQEILAQLREIADGSYVKEFGNGKTVKWAGRMAFIAGVTPAIDTHWAVNQVLGERFVQIRPPQPDSMKVAERAEKNAGHEDEMRKEIQDTVTNFLNGLHYPKVRDITLPDETRERLKYLSAFVCRARSAIERDGYRHEISYIPVPEGPGRLMKQLSTLARGRAIIDGAATLSEDAANEIVAIGMDCIPPHRRTVLEALIDGGDLATTDVSQRTGYPVQTVRRTCEELVALKLATRTTEERTYHWQASEQALEWFEPIGYTPVVTEKSVREEKEKNV